MLDYEWVNFGIGTVVSHKHISYLKKGKIYSFTKHDGVMVDWSDDSGVLFRKHKISSLIILKVENLAESVFLNHAEAFKKL